MIYESAVLAHADTNDEQLASIKAIITGVVTDHKGEILVNDDWGVRALAQPTEKKAKRGHYLYFMYRTTEDCPNPEIDRRLHINESVIRSIIVQLGHNSLQEELVKNYKCPLPKIG
ncbi:MAG: 30S ribosomal protein S6 [Oligoflexia bacterium]|nr:30S ribosomal protein S6 [Oligoflexia bacterium]